LIRLKKLRAPTKDSSGSYLWFEADVRRARAALAAPRPIGRPSGTRPRPQISRYFVMSALDFVRHYQAYVGGL
jgi:hypothetical protein